MRWVLGDVGGCSARIVSPLRAGAVLVLAFAAWFFRAPLASAQTSNEPLRGAFGGGEREPLVLVTQGLTKGSVEVSVYASAPKNAGDLPSCVTAEIFAPPAQIECFTPLRDCVRVMDIARVDADLELRIGAPAGRECTAPWGNTSVRLPRVDFSERLASLYVGSEVARSVVPKELVSKAGDEGSAPLTREIVALLFREAFRNEAMRLRRAEALVSWPYREFLKRCGHPGSEACRAPKARRQAKQVGAEVRREVAKKSASLGLSPVPLQQPAPGWLGTWFGPLGEDGSGNVELEPGDDGKPKLRFSSYLVSDDAACSGNGFPTGALSAEVTCGPCARRLAFRIDGARMIVRLLGDAWRSSSDGDCSYFTDQGEYVFSLTRVDAFRVFAPGFVNESSRSDLGSSGGKIGYTSLGKDMEATANRLGRIIERAYRVAGRDPSRLSVSALNELANWLQMTLLMKCAGLPGGDPPSNCGQAVIDLEAEKVVTRWIAAHGPGAP